MDASGNLYGAGRGYDDAGVNHWLVRKSADGTNWSTVRHLTPPDVSGGDAHLPMLIAVGSGVYMTPRNGSGVWLVDKSDDPMRRTQRTYSIPIFYSPSGGVDRLIVK